MIHTTVTKRKFKRLQHTLQVPLYEAVGVLETLWIITVINARQGDIGRLTDEEVAMEIGWTKTGPTEFVEALVRTGWIDRDGDVWAPGEGWRLIVHDWPDHCPNWVKGNLRSRDLPFVAIGGGYSPVPKAKGKEPGAKASGTKPHATKPNQTKPVSETPTGSHLQVGSSTGTSGNGPGSAPTKLSESQLLIVETRARKEARKAGAVTDDEIMEWVDRAIARAQKG